MKRFARHQNFQIISSQAGASLIIALVVLVVMTLGGVAVLRSMDTGIMIAGNLSFKRDTMNSVSAVLNKTLGGMKDSSAYVTDAEISTGCPAACAKAPAWKAKNFWPRLLETDAGGIPVILKDTSSFDKIFTSPANLIKDDPAYPKLQVRYVVERMCNEYGEATEKTCLLSSNFERGGSQPNDKPGSVALALYRVTLRADGPRNTTTYAQAIVSLAKKDD